MAAHLAIANLQRRLLPGSPFLDQLIAPKSDADLAVIFLDADGTTSSLTYALLHHASWSLAHRIREQQCDLGRANPIIPVILPQGPLLYLSYLGVLRAGAAFCPVLPDTPDERLQFIISDVQADHVLCMPHNVDHLRSLLPSTKCIPLTLTELLNQHPDDDTHHEQSRQPSDIAYVMYTSGSTGKPKGVPVSHQAVTQSLLAHDEHIPAFKRFFQFAAPTFDVSVFEIFFPWFRGATLASCERETTLADLPAVLRQLSVDTVELTPTVATTLLRKRDAVPSLRALLTIGEMLTPQIVQEFGGSTQQAGILFAMYGPTEAAIHCTVMPAMTNSSSVRDIGRPLSTVTAFILKESEDPRNTEILHHGQSGELAVAGQLADGYLNRPVESRSAFIDLPGYGPMYRTGDRAVMTCDGNLQIYGRISGGQVKLRGQRVELGEIESVASQVHGVDLAVAVIFQDTLILFCSGQHSIRSQDIEARCKSWLPRHMRPGGIFVLEEGMPRLPSGKIDRKGLEQIYQNSHMTSSSDESSGENEITSFVKKIVAEEVGTMIDDHQPLWSSGLNSLRAISIASRLREHYHDVSISTILEADNVSHLTTMLEGQNEDTDWSEQASQTDSEDNQWADVMRSVQDKWKTTEKMEVVRIIPCSKMQSAMLAETSRDPSLNLNKIILKTHAPVKFSQVLEALKEIARGSPILGAAFESTGNPDVPFVQIIKSEPSFEHATTMQYPLSVHPGEDDREIVVTIHHALYDGWSWDLVMKDMNTLVNGGSLRARPSFEQFSRLMQQKYEIRVEKDLTAWTSMLQNIEFHRFPMLRSTPPTHPGRSCYSTALSTSAPQLSAFAQGMRVNMATTIHVALSLLLSQYLDTKEVVTGIVLAGREPVMPKVEEVIGPCLLTLPLLVRLSDSHTRRDTLLQVYQQYMHCLRHSSTSLAEIANVLSVPTDTRLFDVLFVWQESRSSSDLGRDKIFTTATYDNLDYALVMEAEAKNGFIHLKTTYDNARLSPDQIKCIHSQINALVNHFVSDPEVLVNCMWDHVPQPLLSISQPPTQSLPDDLTSMLTKTASEFPARIAVDFVKDFDPTTRIVDRETITYEQLCTRASHTASSLVKTHGLRKDDIVAICCTKSPSLYVTICATILAGVAYLCIDPSTPEKRIGTILQQADPKVVIVDGSDDRLMKGSRGWSVLRIEDVVRHEASDKYQIDVHSLGDDLAYAVFTSGSTGVPKGVLITRENLASNLQHLASIYPFNSSSRLLQSCSQAFDVSVFEIFWAWSCGLTLCSATNDTMFKDIESFIDATDVTHLSMTPSVAALVNPSNVPKVTFLVCAGEPMSAKVYRLWVNRGLHQGYGPSETTNICNVRHYPDGPKLINDVGPAFPNTSLFVCARQANNRRNQTLSVADLEILPRGAIGEIWIGGRQVGRGYTDSQLTYQSFFDHPQYGRLFKSGDFGRLMPDDSLVVTGREDDQTKIRGLRIELNEVNSRLMQSIHVLDSYTMILSAEDGRQKLVAFWVCIKRNAGDHNALVNLLYDHLREALPSYMVPESLVSLPKIPLTSQGKVDKRALLTIHNAMGSTELAACSTGYSTSSNQHEPSPTEREITRILTDMINVSSSEINIYGSFFSYGIDSIRAIAFARRLKDASFTTVEVSDVLKHPSVNRLASFLEKPGSAESAAEHDLATEAVPLNIRESVTDQLTKQGLDVAQVLPCTPLQVAMALAHETLSKQAYSNHIVYHLRVDAARIMQAWAAMVDKHHLLRTMFALTEYPEYPCVQVVLGRFELPWHASNDDELRFAGSPFEQPPYVLHLRDYSSRVELHLFIHHALYDAEALVHLQADIQSYCLGDSLAVRPPFSAYLNFMLSTDRKRSEQFWDHTLENVAPCYLAESEARARNTRASATRKVQHPMSWTDLSSHARRISVTPLALLQAALARLLSGYTHSTDICFGTVSSGRNVNVTDVDKMIGPCFNTLPSRARLRQSNTSADICQKFHSFNISVLSYQATSLRDLQRRYSPHGMPLFDALLLLQSVAPELNPEIWTLAHEEGQMAFPFIFEVQHDSKVDVLNLYLHNDTSADSNFLDEILGHFVDMISDTTEHLDMLALDRIPSYCSAASINHAASDRTSDKSSGQILLHRSVRTPKDTPTSRQVITVLHMISKKKFSDITPSTTIFHLGLDSISTVQLAAQLRKEGFQVLAGDLLDEPRVHSIIQLCERRQEIQVPPRKSYDLDAFDQKYRNAIARRLTVAGEELRVVWPCTATQIGILSEYLKSDGRCYYNSLCLRLAPQFDIDRLRDAFGKVIELHAILRTGFVELDDIYIPYAMVNYSRIDPDIKYSNDAPASRVRKPISLQDLSRPPWHIELHEYRGVMYAELHMLHALYDAHSLRTILGDLAALCQGTAISKPPPVEEALRLIVAGNDEEYEGQDILPYSGSDVQVTKFPNLNILRDAPPAFATATLDLKHNQRAVQARCEALGCSLSTVLQAAWAKLLAAYTNQTSVTFGNIYSGRSFDVEDLNEVVFPCINTLPVFVDFGSEEVTVIEQVAKINAHWQRNPYSSLSKINHSLGVQGVLFDTIIALQTRSWAKSDAPWEIESEVATAEYAISLEIFTAGNEVKLLLTYNQAVLPPEHSSILLKQYEQGLCDILKLTIDPSQASEPLSSIRSPICKIIPSEEACLHDLVLASATRNPQKVAIEFVTNVGEDVVDRQTWTYQETIMAASRVANLLIEHGARAGDMIALCCEKSPQASFALLAILMAGCAYVAIDPSAPASRRDFIVEDSQCKIMLVNSSIASNVAKQEGVTLLRVDDEQLFSQQSSYFDSEAHCVSAQDVCYCLYTSGTTGTPKGCLITHESAVQAMMSFSRIFQERWTDNSKWLQFAAYHFDVSVLEHFWSWKEGICVTVVPRDMLFEDLPRTINKVGITHLDLTPSLARLLSPESVPSLCQGVFIVGGEEVRQDIIETWGDAGCLYNFYGPSEVTIGCTVHPRVRRGVKATNIGRPWDNVGALVLEPNTQKPVLIGAVGELCLSGVLVGKGYLNRPELTAEKFTVFETTGERLYRSGDLVRTLYDYSFEFLGRIDDQVKLRGQRLEIGEINHAILKSSSEFQDTTTLVLEHPQQEKQHLVTFLARKKERRGKEAESRILHEISDIRSISQVRSQALNHLPGYMVPTYFIVLNFLPLTVNNKVDLKALRSMYRQMSISDVRKQQQSPSNLTNEESEIYRKFISTIASYLGVGTESIGPHDSLLQLGVDSISVIGLVRALRRDGYANASVVTVLRRPIVTDLATILCAPSSSEKDLLRADQEECLGRMKKFADQHRTAIEQTLHSEVEDIAPCTALQEGMISRLLSDDSQRPPYMTKFVFKLDPMIDLTRIREAWQALKSRLDILRVRFVSTDDGFAQVVLPPTEELVSNVELDVYSVQTDPLTSIHERYKTWAHSARYLGAVAPWEARVTQHDADNLSYMSIFMFHGLYDGISIQNILICLHQLYENLQTRPGTPQFFEALSYGPLLRKSNASEFWQQNLPRICLLNPPTPSHLTYEPSATNTVHRELLTPEVHQACSNLAVTSQAIFHAAWLLALAHQFGRNPTIGIVLSGRSIEFEHADEIVGPLFNTLPFSIDCLPRDARYIDLIQACHRKNIDALPYQHTPLSSIRKYLKFPANQEFFDSLFVFQTTARSAETSHRPWVEIQTESQIEYPLNVEVEELKVNRYDIRIVASADFLGADELASLLDSFSTQLNDLSKASETSLPKCFAETAERVSKEAQHIGTDSDSAMMLGKWTTDAENIRSVLAELACIDGTDIGLNSPTIFELGLDSVDALKLVSRLRGRSIQVSVSKILQNPTVAGMLAQHDLGQVSNLSGHAADLPFHNMQAPWKEKLGRQGFAIDHVNLIVPTTPLQQGLLVEFEKYFRMMIFRISNKVDISRLGKSIRECIQAMAVLRTCFTTIERNAENKPAFMQIITKVQTAADKPQLHCLKDASDLRKFVTNIQSNSDITDSSPKLKIACLENDENYLILALSHASYDAWSIRLMLQHIERAYTGGQPLPDDTRLTAQYVYNLHKEHESPQAEKFWSNQLTNAEPTLVKIDRSSTQYPALLRSRLARTPLDQIRSACRRHGVTLQSLGLATWTLFLITLTRQTDASFGVVVSGRIDEMTEKLVFPTFNTIVFRAGVDTKTSKHRLLQNVHDQAVKFFEYQQFPLSKALSIARKSDGDLFNTLFTFQRTPAVETGIAPLFEEIDVGDGKISPPYAINVELQETDVGLEWTIASQNDVMSAEDIENAFVSLNKILECLIAPEDGNVFQVKGSSVSVCGLPSITFEEKGEDTESGDTSTRPSMESEELASAKAEFSSVESQIRNVFSEVSGIDLDKISKDTSLYHLGLDSISAIKVSRLLKESGIKVPVSMLLKYQTVAKIASATSKIEPSTIASSGDREHAIKKETEVEKFLATPLLIAGIAEDDVEDILPATGGQVYMLDMWRASKGKLFYATFSFEVKHCNRVTFNAAFARLVREVPALRTQFVMDGGKTYQVVFSSSSAVHGPVQYELAEQGSGLIVALHIHHALYDAISLDLMVRRLKRLCSADMHNAEDESRLCTDQQLFLDSLQVNEYEARQFWIDHLAGADGNTKSANSFNLLRTALFVPELLRTASLESVARREGVSFQAMFFATVAHIHAQRKTMPEGVRSDTTVIGIYLANRSLDIEGLSDLVVPTFNIVPLKINTAPVVSVLEAAKKVQVDLREITKAEHCGISIRDIHAWVDINIDCYVNFLRLPDAEVGTVRTKQQGDAEVEIEHAEGELRERAKSLLQAEQAVSPFIQGSIVDEHDADWCSPALDVEAKVDEQGNLAVGMFAPGDMLDGIGIRRLMEELRSLLYNIGTA